METFVISPLLQNYNRAEIAFVRGEGPYLFDEKGQRYLDFGTGLAVTGLGHCHPHLVEALREQAGKLWHTSNLYRVPGQEILARRLVENSFADVAFFCNSGAEAMEAAIKMARHHHFTAGNPERYRLITFEGAFHGRTLATIAAGGTPKYLEGFGPKVEGFDQVPAFDFDTVARAYGHQTAGILIEPIQGEIGIRTPPAGFLKRLREFCNQKGILLVFDEVQTGLGRLGRLFAYEEAGIAPDLMGIAKGLGGGFPVGACLATERAAKGMVPGTHGTTFGGNPLAMAAANATLDVMLAPGFLERVRSLAGYLQQRVSMLAAEHASTIAEIRGGGLMLGLRLNVPNAAFVAKLREKRVLAVGATENVVRLLPPLIIEERHIDEAISALSETCAAFQTERKAV
jgi:acetylornithine/N-succinyldiaminopimelate aminotransferase